MLKIKPGSRFKKDLKKFKHSKSTLSELDKVLKTLVRKEELAVKYQDHTLSGAWNSSRECHIKPDVLLVYRVDKKAQLLILERLGSHSELFK